MAKKARTKRNEKIRRLAVEGYTRQQTGRIVHLHPNSVASILRAYIVRGELMEVPNTNPRVYYDPHVRAIEEDVEKTRENGGCVENIALIVSRGYSDCMPEGGLPPGWVNMHLTGMAISMKVRKVGTFDDIPSPGVGYCGYWDRPKAAGKGMTLRHCHLPHIFRQRKVGAVFRQGSKGGRTFTVNPGRIYFDPEKISQYQAKQLLLDRAMLIASLLERNGWQVTDPEIKGTVHIGKENDPLAEFIPYELHDDRNQISVDFSPGKMTCESEIEGGVDDEGLCFYANVPKHFQELKREHEVMKGFLKEQSEMMIDLSANVDMLLSITMKLTTQAAAQVQCSFPRFTGEGYQ